MPRGRPKGSKNKVTVVLKDAIMLAADRAGPGLVAYLEKQAKENPGPFLALLGKVLPTQHGSDPDNPMKVVHEVVDRVIVRPDHDEYDRSEAVH